jgi:hypothetical protein
MLRRLLGAVAVIALLPSPAFAWGFSAHRLIMRRAIEILPPEIKPFFVAHRDALVTRVVDPDMWRSVGWEEDGNHFLNLGTPEFGAKPAFAGLPRDYTAALQKFGIAALDRHGKLPWREAEMFGNLQRAFADLGDANAFTVERLIMFTGAASHYIQDATQPLHATVNYDGIATDQRGIHTRFEAELIERFDSQLMLTPAPPKPIGSPRDYTFDTLIASFQNVEALLKADKEAVGAKETYDDAYYQAFFVKVKPMLEAQLSAAVTSTASVIVSAWEQAGRPALYPKGTRQPRKVQRAR